MFDAYLVLGSIPLTWSHHHYLCKEHLIYARTHANMLALCLLNSHHLVARVYESKAEFRSALQHEKEGYTIYKNQVCHRWMDHARKKKSCSGSFSFSRLWIALCVVPHQVGEAHEKTKESSEYLKYLTQQAVALQRTMNEIYKNGSNASIMPLKVSEKLVLLHLL